MEELVVYKNLVEKFKNININDDKNFNKVLNIFRQIQKERENLLKKQNLL